MSGDVPLLQAKVYRNLRYSWSLLGFTLEDIVVVVNLTLISFVVEQWFGLSPLWGLAMPFASAVGILLLKWRRPDGYLRGLLLSVTSPRRLSHLGRDRNLPLLPAGVVLVEDAEEES